MRKITVLVAGGIGYVLGARAGRQRYEQIRNAALRVKSNPTVQQTAHHAADAAKEAAPVVKDKVVGAAGAAASKVKSGSSDDTGSDGVSMESSAYPRSDSDAKGAPPLS
jgi:hypothetical protein